MLIGRDWVFALAAGGESGVRDVLTALRDGLATTVTGLGHADVSELNRSDLVIPEGFELDLDDGSLGG